MTRHHTSPPPSTSTLFVAKLRGTSIPMDDLLDPYADCVQEGRIQGQRAGEAEGFQQGLQYGQTTAVNYGMEVGFYQGVLDGLRTEEQRIQKTIDILQELIRKFPPPERLFHADGNENVQEDLQRIRARFKLLTTQLGIPHFTWTTEIRSQQKDTTAW